MADQTFAEATMRKIRRQEAELVRLRLRVRELERQLAEERPKADPWPVPWRRKESPYYWCAKPEVRGTHS
jgi:hypothetical protein